MKTAELSAKNQYGAYAVGACRAERNGEWSKAAELWQRASSSVCGHHNRQWAEMRACFCVNAAQRGWSVLHAG